MKELAEKAAKAIMDDNESLTSVAVAIADYSLHTFNGKLLEKALAISRAIVDFEDEIKSPT